MIKLRILISAYACNPSGSLQLHPGEDLTGWMLARQAARRHHVWVVTHSYNRPGIEGSPPGDNPKDIHFVFVSLPRPFRWLYRFGIGERLYYYFWQIAAWRAAVRLHRQYRFDIAHHLTFGNYWMPSFIGAFLPIPFVWGPVGGGQITPASLFNHYSLAGQFAEMSREMAQWLGRNLLYSRYRCLKRARAILVCNVETKHKFPQIAWPRIVFFPVNGISADDVAPPYRLMPASPFRVLTAGRLIRLKGFDLCIEAFTRLVKIHPDCLLEIVGQGPEENRLRRMVKGLNLEEKVRFIPWLERRLLLQKMRQSDVFLFASFRDGGGAVVVEAMASGLPVVCLNAGGPGFHIQEAWGMKIKVGNPKESVGGLAQALLALQENPALRIKLGRAAEKRARDYYPWDVQGRRLEAIYLKTLGFKSSSVSD
jgi:glycosyltransferase involved in cell wall biosynthesis